MVAGAFRFLFGRARSAPLTLSDVFTPPPTHFDVVPPKIAWCPRCGNKAPQEMLHQAQYQDVIGVGPDNQPIYEYRWWAILKCGTCSGLSLWNDFWNEHDQRWEPALAHPRRLQAPPEVPSDIAQAFDDVVAAKSLAPGLAAVGVRRVLEAIADDQHAPGRTFSDQIKFLGTEGIIPTQLADMMDVSRTLGNLGAHFTGFDVTQDDVATLTEFVLALFEYIYVAPAKVEAFRRSVDQRKT